MRGCRSHEVTTSILMEPKTRTLVTGSRAIARSCRRDLRRSVARALKRPDRGQALGDRRRQYPVAAALPRYGIERLMGQVGVNRFRRVLENIKETENLQSFLAR